MPCFMLLAALFYFQLFTCVCSNILTGITTRMWGSLNSRKRIRFEPPPSVCGRIHGSRLLQPKLRALAFAAYHVWTNRHLLRLHLRGAPRYCHYQYRYHSILSLPVCLPVPLPLPLQYHYHYQYHYQQYHYFYHYHDHHDSGTTTITIITTRSKYLHSEASDTGGCLAHIVVHSDPKRSCLMKREEGVGNASITDFRTLTCMGN